MRLVELTREDFDNFAKNYKNASFYQTSAYGRLMQKLGFDDFYIGIKDDNNTIICGSMFMKESKKSVIGTITYAYAPRGFLIDYNNHELLTFYTKELKKFLLKKGLTFVRIDPPIIHKERDKTGNIKAGGIDNSSLIIILQTLGYEHLGFNTYFEALKPRWNAITKLNGNSKKLFSSFNKETKNKIRKAEKLGIEIVESDRNSITKFFNFIENKHIRGLDYYIDFYDLFNKDDMFHIYFAKINPIIYLQNAKKAYEKEQINNMKIINKMTKYKNNYSLVNKKMESDKLLSVYKNDIIRATNLSINYPDGVLIGTCATVCYNGEVFFLIDGYDKAFHNLSANHLLKWKVMENFANKGYTSFNLNGITGDFSKENEYYGLYKFKMGFASDVCEYIGEFDLIINAPIYQMYRSVPQLQQYLRKQ